jgi:hypothetical protein
VFRRVSELVYIRGRPKAILRWIDIAGVRTPIYAELDPAKLSQPRTPRGAAARYEGTTTEPADEIITAPGINAPNPG